MADEEPSEEPFLDEAAEADRGAAGRRVDFAIPERLERVRLDKALAEIADPALGLSRSRLRTLIEAGRVRLAGETLLDPARKVKPGEEYRLDLPPPAPARPAPEAIPLSVLYEDAHLIVVDKPVGMAVHPAPGTPGGTLVNALLAHCGDSLSGIGGEARPGIVHRIDKDTSGLLAAAKTDLAHQGLARQFAEHSVERAYLALCWGAPVRADPRLSGHPATRFEEGGLRIEAAIARHRTDRKRMAVVSSGGRRAVTWARVLERIGPAGAPFAALLECRLETGRTHQIRVHLSHLGHPLLGDPVYGRARTPPKGLDPEVAEALTGFPRQALHAATLGFEHPATGERLRFETPPPQDLLDLLAILGTEFARRRV